MTERRLKDDGEIAEMLTEHNTFLRDQMTKVDGRLKSLYRQSDSLNSGLQHFQCRIDELKQSKYVQEVIIDEGSESFSRRSVGLKLPTFVNGPKELQEKAGGCAAKGLQMISEMFKSVAVELPREMIESGRLIPNDIYEPIDVHLICDLPPIIGTQRFAAWNVHEVMEQTPELSEVEIGGRMEPKRMSVVQPISVDVSSAGHSISPPPSNYLDEISESTPPPLPETVTSVREPVVTADIVNYRSLKTDLKPTKFVNPRPIGSKPPAPIKRAKPRPRIELPDETKTSNQTADLLRTTSSNSRLEPITQTAGSDDSFDELFKQTSATLVLPPAKSSDPEVKIVQKTSLTDTIVTSQKQFERSETRKKADKRNPTKTVVKRSIFDTSSSEEDPPVRVKPPPKPTLLKSAVAQIGEESVGDEEMPKTVLNSVGGDFSNRLNEALLKRPQQQPNNTVNARTSTSAVSASSSSSDTNEAVDLGPQPSVSALRGKLGASITRIHTHGKVSDDEVASKSSGDEKSKKKNEQLESPPSRTDLIQNLKTRPRPPNRRNPGNKPPASTSLTTPVLNLTATTNKTKTAATTDEKKTTRKSLFDTDSDEPF